MYKLINCIFFLILFFFNPSCLFSQSPDTLKVINLSETVISVNKQVEVKKNVAQTVMVISRSEIENLQANTTADIISGQGIAIQKSQLGGGSPVMRGFEASRIVLMIDGVRLNNLIYRSGHLQEIIKTDNSSLEKIEIVFGPSSTIYGSDALGGVIHLYTKNPVFSDSGKTRFTVNALSRYQTACNAFTQHIAINVASKNIASLSSVSYSKFGHLISGKNQNPFYRYEYGTRPYFVKYLGNGKDTIIPNSNKYKQISTGYTQYDIIQKFLYKQNNSVTHAVNLQFSNTTDIPRYDRLTDASANAGLISAEWYYGPQKRLLAAYDFNMVKPHAYFQSLHMIINYQNLVESRHNRNFNSKFKNNRQENVSVLGCNIDLIRKIKSQTIRTGADIQINSLASTAFRQNIVDNTKEKLDTRYPDGSNYLSTYALYLSHTGEIIPQLKIVDGLRAGYSMLYSTFIDTATLFHLPYNSARQNTFVYSGNLGFIYTPVNNLKLSLLASTGFRVPNIDDLSKVFGSAPGSVIVPNPDLKPEETINYELGITKVFNSVTQWENNVYYTAYRNIAVVDYYSFNGQDSILYDGTMSRVFANQNKQKAFIYGICSNLISYLNSRFTFSLSLNYTYGRIKTDSTNYPLDHIPPFAARTSLKYNYNKFSSDFFVIYNGWKKLKDYYLNGEDNEQYATNKGMPAWFTINMRISLQVNKFISMQAGIDNILDHQYRTFASGINAPGRNFIIALRGNF